MTAPAPVASWRTFLGFAAEVTQGTPVTTPTSYFKPSDPPDFEPLGDQIEDKGLRGAPVDTFNLIQGIKGTNYGFKGAVFADTIPVPIVGVLGELATTGGSAPYSHTITLLNSSNGQPHTWTAIDNLGAECRQIPGLLFEEVTLSFTADKLLTFDTKAQGWPSSTLSAPTPSFTTQVPLAAWQLAATIAGSASTLVLDGTVTIKRNNVGPIKTADGTQTPSVMWGGTVMVTGKLTLIFADDTELARFLSNTTCALVLDLSNGASAALVEVKMTMTSVQYTSGKPDRTGAFVKLPVDFMALGNTTDVGASGGYSPIKCLIKNAVAAGNY